MKGINRRELRSLLMIMNWTIISSPASPAKDRIKLPVQSAGYLSPFLVPQIVAHTLAQHQGLHKLMCVVRLTQNMECFRLLAHTRQAMFCINRFLPSTYQRHMTLLADEETVGDFVILDIASRMSMYGIVPNNGFGLFERKNMKLRYVVVVFALWLTSDWISTTLVSLL